MFICTYAYLNKWPRYAPEQTKKQFDLERKKFIVINIVPITLYYYHFVGFYQLVQKLEWITPIISTLQDKQNEWSLYRITSAHQKKWSFGL